MTYTDSTSGTYIDYGRQYYIDNTYRYDTNTITYPYQWTATSSDSTFDFHNLDQYLNEVVCIHIKKGWTKLLKPPENKKIKILSIDIKPNIDNQQLVVDGWLNLYFIVPRNKQIYAIGIPQNTFGMTASHTFKGNTNPIIDKALFVKSEGEAILSITYKYID